MFLSNETGYELVLCFSPMRQVMSLSCALKFHKLNKMKKITEIILFQFMAFIIIIHFYILMIFI